MHEKGKVRNQVRGTRFSGRRKSCFSFFELLQGKKGIKVRTGELKVPILTLVSAI
jgi:hypothetical protein